MSAAANNDASQKRRPMDPFRRAVLRGLAVLLPPLLTIVIFLWVGNTVAKYILVPLEDAARTVIVWSIADIRPTGEMEEGDFTRVAEGDGDVEIEIDGQRYRLTSDDKYVPSYVYDRVRVLTARTAMPTSSLAIYERYVDVVFLRREFVIPLFLAVFVLVMYLLGRFIAAGIGRFFWAQFESLIHRLPLVRNVYSSVKQVTDFLFTDPELDYTRVIAFEYPRKGLWTLAFVTGESMLDIESAANEPVMSVLVPTSPMPFTGFTITVKKSETIDLNITIDQAFQFVVSCGVVVPPQQLTEGGLAAARRNGPVDPPPRSRLPMPATPSSE